MKKTAIPCAVNITMFITLLLTLSMVNGAVLEEVVVTAQKKESSMQELGLSVNAFSGETLDNMGINSPNDVAALTPNLEIKNQLGGATPVITIRGVGMNDVNPNIAPAAGVYIDEIFLPSTVSLNFGLFDVERVEVLKGPQGTLYGRNSTAGAINFITRRPHQDFEAYVEAGYDEYDKINVKGAINGGLSDNLSGRLALTYANSSDGFFDNRFTGGDYGKVDRFTARGSLLWDVSEATQVFAKVEIGFDESDTGGTPAHLGLLDAPGRTCNAVQGQFDVSNAVNCVDVSGYQDTDGDPYKGDWNAQGVAIDGNTGFEAQVDSDSVNALIQIDHDFEHVTFTSITGYLNLDHKAGFDNDGSPFQYRDGIRHSEVEQISQEFRLTSTRDRLNWIAGIYYSQDDVIEPARLATQDDSPRNWLLRMNFDQNTETAAAFAHVTYAFSDQLKGIAGIRYTWEERDFAGNTLIIRPDLTTIVRNNTYESDVNAENVSGKIGLNWRPTDDLLIYGSVSNAFKSPGINGGFISNPRAERVANTEQIIAFELGTKWTALDGAMQVNLAYFYYDYTDMQVRIRRPTDVARVLGNAEQVDVHGLDFDLAWAATESLTLRLGAGYINSKVKDDDLLANSNSSFPNDPQITKLDLANAPEFTFNGSISYEQPIGDNLALGVLADFSWADKQFLTTENWEVSNIDSQHTLNATLYLAGGDKWRASLYAKNLTDEENLVRVESVGANSQALIGYYAAPRVVGFNLRYSWAD